ncbi:MAG: DegT/DnrJ/EryC1/StrS family aminotransferase [Elusimicrobiota bacterium]|jgi:dTDP-4-amino-4,6-dideoxygalactose transaminase
MNIVSFPDCLVASYLRKAEELFKTGKVAEGHFYQESSREFLPGKDSVPVCSGGAAIFCLLAYYKYACSKTHVIIQSNTMRALYTVPKLLGMEVLVADSATKDFLAMTPESLASTVAALPDPRAAVVVYSVIGGFLSPSYREIESYCEKNRIPLIVDAAHAHYLEGVLGSAYADLAFSFYATKILPSGEGGLVSTRRADVYSWVRRFLIYDKHDMTLSYGLNLRANELTACLIHMLMTGPELREYYRDKRVEIASAYRRLCEAHGVAYLDFKKADDYNGYKFVILDKFEDVAAKNTLLTRFGKTTPVFETDVRGGDGTLPHWCPPTYVALHHEICTAESPAKG